LQRELSTTGGSSVQSLTLTRLAVRPQPAARGTLAVEAADGVAAVALAAALVPLTLIHVWEGEEEKDKDVNGHILKLISFGRKKNNLLCVEHYFVVLCG